MGKWKSLSGTTFTFNKDSSYFIEINGDRMPPKGSNFRFTSNGKDELYVVVLEDASPSVLKILLLTPDSLALKNVKTETVIHLKRID